MDATQMLSIFLRGALGLRGRKRSSRARGFLTGHKGFLTTSTLLTAAGLAWGVYDSLKAEAPGTIGATGGSGTAGTPGTAGHTAASAASGAVAEPSVARDMLPFEVLRLVRLAVSAARADGTLAPEERALILEHARAAGIAHVVERELDTPHPMASLVGGISDVQRRKDLYVLAFAIVRADESVTGAERIYLAQLAHQLVLDPATVATLEQQAAAGIDMAEGSQRPQGSDLQAGN